MLVLIYLDRIFFSSPLWKMSFPFYILLIARESYVTLDEDWLYVKFIFGRYQAQTHPILSAHNAVKFLLLLIKTYMKNMKVLYESA